MIDLNTAIVTDFTASQWKYLDKKDRKAIEARTPKYILRAWRTENYDQMMSFSIGKLIKVLCFLLMVVIIICVGGLEYIKHFHPEVWYKNAGLYERQQAGVVVAPTAPVILLDRNGDACPTHDCPGGFTDMGAYWDAKIAADKAK